MKNFITRFAPSPTGYLHIGNLRTAIIAWLYCKKNNGKFILRIDDTDLVRSRKECEDQIMIDLKDCGLLWDENFHQSQRGDIYNEYTNYLKSIGLVYPCFETKEDLDLARKTATNMKRNFIYDRKKALNLSDEEKSSQKTKPHYRFKLNHEKKIFWDDEVKGELSFDPSQISDPVVIREDGTFTYLLISVIDDICMKISSVIRGEDHVSNTATQIQMFEAFKDFKGYDGKLPSFAHLPLLKMEDKKISKRTGGFEIFNLLDEGMLPVSFINYLMHLGSNLRNALEPELDVQKLIEKFNICSYNNASPNYSEKDLEKLNIKNIQEFSDEQIQAYFEKIFKDQKINFNSTYWKIYKNNIENINEIPYWQSLLEKNGCEYINFLKENSHLYSEFLNGPEKKIILKIALKYLEGQSNDIKESFLDKSKNVWGQWISLILGDPEILNKFNKKDLFLTLRFFFTGKEFGPEMNLLIKFFGYEKILNLLKGYFN